MIGNKCSIKKYIINILMVLILVCLGMLTGCGLTDIDDEDESVQAKVGNKSGMIEVPDVSYLAYTEAVENLNAAGFKNIDYKIPDGGFIIIEKNWGVLSQSVEAGKQVDPKTKIMLNCIRINDAESSEKKADSFGIDMPNMVGVRYDRALISLREMGFCDISYKTATGGDIVKLSNWEVCEQSISAGMNISNKTGIILTCKRIAGGNAAGSATVPDVMGLDMETARKKLEEAGLCNIFQVSDNGQNIVKLSNWGVIAQSISPGESVSGSTVITITCTRIAGFSENESVAMINVQGKAYDVALGELNRLGFKNVTYETDTGETIIKQSNWGVVSQNIHEGEVVLAGSEVHLVCTRIAGTPSTTKAATVAPTTKATETTKETKLAYKRTAKDYEIYILIDFDENVVYWFTTHDSTYDKAPIISGDLNNGLVVDYYGKIQASMNWHYKDQKSTLYYHYNGGDYEFRNCDWNNAYRRLQERTEISPEAWN